MIYFSIFLSILAITLCIAILFKFESIKKEKLEKEIKDLNKEKTTITLKLSDSKLEYAEIEKLSTRFKDIALIIDEKELRWLELSDLF
jgi:ATP-binding cassette subfamily F protein uup